MGNEKENQHIRDSVREEYAGIASGSQEGCCAGPSCCGEQKDYSEKLGYSSEEKEKYQESEMGLGCGNPQAIDAIKSGETVVDLGCGAGFDCFLAAGAVGPNGRAIGIDMTPEMIAKARENARKNDFSNVEFRLGEIEHLPVGDNEVDVVISNCVINLSPEKMKVFKETHRILKPGGRLAIADVVMIADPPADYKNNPEKVAGCISGAAKIEELQKMLEEVGFSNIEIKIKENSRDIIESWQDGERLADFLVSAYIKAVREK